MLGTASKRFATSEGASNRPADRRQTRGVLIQSSPDPDIDPCPLSCCNVLPPCTPPPPPPPFRPALSSSQLAAFGMVWWEHKVVRTDVMCVELGFSSLAPRFMQPQANIIRQVFLPERLEHQWLLVSGQRRLPDNLQYPCPPSLIVLHQD